MRRPSRRGTAAAGASAPPPRALDATARCSGGCGESAAASADRCARRCGRRGHCRRAAARVRGATAATTERRATSSASRGRSAMLRPRQMLPTAGAIGAQPQHRPCGVAAGLGAPRAGLVARQNFGGRQSQQRRVSSSDDPWRRPMGRCARSRPPRARRSPSASRCISSAAFCALNPRRSRSALSRAPGGAAASLIDRRRSASCCACSEFGNSVCTRRA